MTVTELLALPQDALPLDEGEIVDVVVDVVVDAGLVAFRFACGCVSWRRLASTTIEDVELSAERRRGLHPNHYVGRCFTGALAYVLAQAMEDADAGLRLVHGVLASPSAWRLAHAWVEIDDAVVVDGARHTVQALAEWRRGWCATSERTYTAREALTLATASPGLVRWHDSAGQLAHHVHAGVAA